MRDLFRRTSFFFWQYPVLWLPVIVADLFAFSIRLLQTSASRAIVRAFEYRSVFGGEPEPSVDFLQSAPKIFAITGPLYWGTHLVVVALYTLAFIGTAALLRTRRDESGRGFMNSVLSFQVSPRHAAIFALKVFGLVLIAAFLFVPLSFVFGRFSKSRAVWAGDYGYIYGLVIMVALAYVVTPLSIQLLRRSQDDSIPVQVIRLGQILAMSAMFVSASLGWIVPRMESSFLIDITSYLGVLLMQAVGSLVAAFPYVFVFIGISLIAQPEAVIVSFLEDQASNVEVSDLPVEE